MRALGHKIQPGGYCEDSEHFSRGEIAVFFLLFSSNSFADQVPPTPMVVTLSYSNSKATYQINSKEVTGGILKSISQARAQNPTAAVYLLVSDETPIKIMYDTTGIMSKADIIKPRIFVFNENDGWMVEWSQGCPMILSKDMSQLTPLNGGYGCRK